MAARTLALAAAVLLAGGTARAAAPAGPDLEWHGVRWPGGTARVAVLPPRPGVGHAPRPVVFVLPGGVGTTDLVLGTVDRYWSDEPARRGWWVVALEGDASHLETTGASLLPALFDWMGGRGMDTARVALAGTSNGGLGAFFAAAAVPGRFDALLGLPGRFVGTLEEASRLRGLPIRLYVGAQDGNWLDGARETERVLGQVGVDVLVTVLPDQGHRVDVPASELMDWIDGAVSAVEASDASPRPRPTTPGANTPRASVVDDVTPIPRMAGRPAGGSRQ